MRAASFLGALALAMSGAALAVPDNYSCDATSTEVTFNREDGMASVSLRLLEALPALNTTKAYAQYVMDSYQGFNLEPVLDLRGFSFQYVDNAPCAGLITYFDGRSYLLFTACGPVERRLISSLFGEANQRLHLDEALRRQAHPQVY
ncbi:MAG: hypothetical protein K6A65_04925 [Succinivibrionaceae bacterium]|nr:hypothetical protein [Succinivibrionaceae bacterium]